ncbi:MAG: tyrosine-type recombinase/integrase, partial [Campylobacterota bacterium]|nr:tyrosine-type recombinase/integrase [Campylobacterota bacterium]
MPNPALEAMDAMLSQEITPEQAIEVVKKIEKHNESAKPKTRGSNKSKALNNKGIKGSKPKEKDYKLYDGEGLFLLVAKTGGKRWRLKYRFEGKEKILALGVYPDLGLADARIKSQKYRQQIANGINPADVIKAEKEERNAIHAKKINTLKKVIDESMAKRNDLSENYLTRLQNAFNNDVIPFIGELSIVDVTKTDILDVVERVEQRGAIESAHRLLTQLNRVFKYALNKDYIEKNVCERIDRKEALKTPTAKSYPTITDKKTINIMLNMIDEYSGDFSTRLALTFMPYVASRPYNIRHAEWSEMDFEKKRWLIPASKMKTKQEHIVPLTDRAIEILKEAQKFSDGEKYIFPSFLHKHSPMSDNTLRRALQRMGFPKEQFVPHAFRSMFSTIANDHLREHKIHPKVIDTQLAHSTKSKVEGAYNRAEYMDDRIV